MSEYRAEPGRGIRNQPSVRLEPDHLAWIDIDAGDLQTRRPIRPSQIRDLQTRADPDGEIAVSPEFVAGDDRGRELVILWKNPASAAKGNHWRSQTLRQRPHLGLRSQGAAADKDDRASRQRD